MNKLMKTAALAAVLGFAANNVLGAGFALYEFSARGNAMGGAVMANKAEAASLAVNPALITQIEGAQVQAGATFVVPSATTAYAGQSRDMEDKVFTLPNAYFTYQASENVFLGLAGFSRFGLGGSYGDYKTWAGSSVAYDYNVLSFSVTPVIAAKVTDDLSLSMGLEYMYIDFMEKKYMGGVDAKIEGDGGSWGGVFGAYYNPEWASKWGAGISYRTKVRQVLDGSVSSNVPANPVLPDGSVRGSVTLPDSLNFGLSFAPVEQLVLEAGIIGTFWSSYDAIRIEYPETASLKVDEKHYKDAIRLNVGAEYALNKNWDIRTGYAYDQSPANSEYMDTLVPVGDRHLFNFGLGYKQKDWGVDLAYTYLLGKNMSGYNNTKVPVVARVPVKYENGDSHMIGVTFKYAFSTPFLRSAK